MPQNSYGRPGKRSEYYARTRKEQERGSDSPYASLGVIRQLLDAPGLEERLASVQACIAEQGYARSLPGRAVFPPGQVRFNLGQQTLYRLQSAGYQTFAEAESAVAAACSQWGDKETTAQLMGSLTLRVYPGGDNHQLAATIHPADEDNAWRPRRERAYVHRALGKACPQLPSFIILATLQGLSAQDVSYLQKFPEFQVPEPIPLTFAAIGYDY